VILYKIIIIFTLLFSFLHAENEYELGSGVQVGSLPFYVGGYFSVDYKNMDDYERYRVDDLAFLGYGSYSKFSYLVEFEYKELYVKTDNNGVKETTKDIRLYAERIYLDYNLDENYMFRVGKYNSPIGFWNLLPVNVLRETTSNPMSSYIIFPKFTTGVSVSYTSYREGEFKIDLMLQHNDDIDDEYNNYQLDKHYGFGISYEKDELTYKLNGGYFHSIDDVNVNEDDLYYFLLSAKYETDNYQIQAELGTQRSDEYFTTKYAGYLQGVYRFTQQHIGIVRLESYDNQLLDVSDNMAIVAYTYRPLYPIAIKSEYQFHSLHQENQFLFSFSVLF